MSAKKKQTAPVTIPTITYAGKIVSENSESILALKAETLRWLFSIIAALLVYLLAAFVIRSMYHPDINALMATAKNLLIDSGSVRPEPMEALLFRTAVVIIISCLIGFYIFFSKSEMVKALAQSQFFLFFSILCFTCIAAMIYFDFAAQNPYVKGGGDMPQNSRDLVGNSNFDFFFDGLFLGSNILIYTFILVPALACLFFIGIRRYNWDKNSLFNKVVSGTGYVVVAGSILAIVLMNTFEFPYTFENKYDFSAAYYSMTQVFAGVPLLVNGFTDTYGLYPHFLNPIFQVIGLNVFKFSLVMSLLLGAAFIFNFLVLKNQVKNKVILFLGFTSVILLPYLDFRLLTSFDCTFSFFPIRYIIPSTLVFLASIYLNKRSNIVYRITFILMAFFVLWNPEIGIVCYLSWLAFNTYNDFYSKEGKVAIKKILLHWAIGIVLLLAVFYFYKIVIYIFYGASPDLSLLYSTIVVFGKVGFNLLPMVLVHPWNLMALTLIAGFTYAVSKWYKKDITAKASIVFLVSMIGVGFFVYFQGRSHNWPFAWSTGFSWLLLTILGDELWEKVKNDNVLPLNILFVIFLFAVSFSFFEIIFNTPKINELVYQNDDKDKQEEEWKRLSSNTDFILKNSKEKEKIYVFTAGHYQALYFNGNKRVSAFNPGDIDMFLNTDLAAMSDRISDSTYSIFIEPELCNNSRMFHVLPAVAASYEYKAVNQSMDLLTKRKAKIPAKAVLGQSEPVVVHKKYTDDTSGIRARINDANGITPVALNPEFSVEVIFSPKAQIFKFATLIGNMSDTGGFLIANVLNSPNYFFGINGKGLSLPMANTPWVYCVMNVYPDRVEIYENGNAAGTMPLEKPMRNSPEKLSVGNLGYFRNYIGAISEICVTNKALDKNKIQTTWEEIKGLSLF